MKSQHAIDCARSRVTEAQEHLISVDAELAGPVSLGNLAGLHAVHMDGPRLHCEADPAALNDLLRCLTETGVVTLTCRPPTLEELFLRLYSSERPTARATG